MSNTGDESIEIVGNSLEPTAYHEAGHIVAAAVEGLTLRPAGITVYRITETVTSGFAAYREKNVDGTPFDDLKREGMMVALMAGVNAQVKVSGEGTAGSGNDADKFMKLLDEHYKDDWNNTQDRIYARVQLLLKNHWGAVVAVASAVMEATWAPVEPGEFPEAQRKKQLDGNSIATMLKELGITAQVQ
jgi:hypothetical protein